MEMLKAFIKYLIVGSLNGVIYFILLYLLTDVAKLWYMFSAVVAVVLQTLITFGLHRAWTFADRKVAVSNPITLVRFIKYGIAGVGGLVFGLACLYVITEYFNQWYMVSAIIASYLLLVARFFIDSYWTWRETDWEKMLLNMVLVKVGLGKMVIELNDK